MSELYEMLSLLSQCSFLLIKEMKNHLKEYLKKQFEMNPNNGWKILMETPNFNKTQALLDLDFEIIKSQMKKLRDI